MKTHQMKVKRLSPEAKLPEYAHDGKGTAAFDIFTTETVSLFPGERHTFKTGIASSFSPKFFLKLEGKSGLAHKQGITIIGGVIDANYRGEWGIIALNTGRNVVDVQAGDKVAQGTMLPVVHFKFKSVKTLPESTRGHGAYGSTGR